MEFWPDGFAGQQILLARWLDVQLARWPGGPLTLWFSWPAGFVGLLVLLARWFCWAAGIAGPPVLLDH